MFALLGPNCAYHESQRACRDIELREMGERHSNVQERLAETERSLGEYVALWRQALEEIKTLRGKLERADSRGSLRAGMGQWGENGLEGLRQPQVRP